MIYWKCFIFSSWMTDGAFYSLNCHTPFCAFRWGRPIQTSWTICTQYLFSEVCFNKYVSSSPNKSQQITHVTHTQHTRFNKFMYPCFSTVTLCQPDKQQLRSSLARLPPGLHWDLRLSFVAKMNAGRGSEWHPTCRNCISHHFRSRPVGVAERQRRTAM